MTRKISKPGSSAALLAFALSAIILPFRATAQDGDQFNDPPTRVARLGYIEGSVSLQPAGVDDWVQAVPNRPLTTGDQLWTSDGSRAELQLGSAVIRLSENTSFSFLELDDHTVQIQLSSGSITVRLRRLDYDDYFEVDTPNLAFTASQPGSYRLDASSDGGYTVVSLRDGQGQATGSGRTYALYGGQRGTFYGSDSLYANVEDIGGPDQFDSWSFDRDRRYDQSPSARYLSHDVVGYEDLDENGDWHDDPNYGHVWFPRTDPGWAPYRNGHWDWIDPWGYTWVDDASWGYAPFHYGRWVNVYGRWGWVAGPRETRAVYAPALVVFFGGGGGFGGNVAWFPLGPREVYVPPYQTSRDYMNRVNVSNTNVNTTIVTNVYNTTIVNKTVNITNVTYANRNVQGGMTAVPQAAFAGAQPVAHAAVAISAQQIANAQVTARVAVVPTHQSVLGARSATAGHVAAPPAALISRPVVANHAPPPPPVSFVKQQQALAAHPGQPVAKSELQTLRPTGSAAPRPTVIVAPVGKPAAPVVGHPTNLPTAAHPMPTAPTQPNRPNMVPQAPTPPPQGNRPDANRPEPPFGNRVIQPTPQPQSPTPPQQGNRPDANRPQPPFENRVIQPAPEPQRPQPPPQGNRPDANRPAPPFENRPIQPTPEPQRPQPPVQQQRTPPPPPPVIKQPPPPPPSAAKPPAPGQNKPQDNQKNDKPAPR